MRLAEAIPPLERACNKPFRDLFPGHSLDLRTNKGNVGQLLLRYLGLPLDSARRDFEDGELKTNKADRNGMPVETMFITQISEVFDGLVSVPSVSWERSSLHEKISNLVFLPVVKDAEFVADWYFVRVIHVKSGPGTALFEVLKKEYESICRGLVEHIEVGRDGMLHTTNGPAGYIQVRTKDSKPYHPIYSRRHGRYISDKNFSFYFMKKFMEDAVLGRLPRN